MSSVIPYRIGDKKKRKMNLTSSFTINMQPKTESAVTTP